MRAAAALSNDRGSTHPQTVTARKYSRTARHDQESARQVQTTKPTSSFQQIDRRSAQSVEAAANVGFEEAVADKGNVLGDESCVLVRRSVPAGVGDIRSGEVQAPIQKHI